MEGKHDAPRRYHSPVREVAADKTRSRLVAAATRLLRSPAGANRCTLDAVAKAAGVTRLTVYNTFGSRSGLFEAVFDERAKRGGLERIADAMRLPDPLASIDAVVAVFVDFWTADGAVLGNLYALGSTDPELRSSLEARNERRRHLFGVLTGRLSAGGSIAPDLSRELADVLFALTGYGFYADLAGCGRNAESIQPLILAMARDTVIRFSLSTAQ
jgi:AcrR family transcriptional regulator